MSDNGRNLPYPSPGDFGHVPTWNMPSDSVREGHWTLNSCVRRYILGPSFHSAVARVTRVKDLPGPRSAGAWGVPSAYDPWQPLQPRSTNK